MFEQPVLLGFACDEGVRRNNGRVGAFHGPDAIRAALKKISGWPVAPLSDEGTVYCKDGDLESAQSGLAARVCSQLSKGCSPIVIGGGHEIAWGSYQGISQYQQSTKSVGIINFDAHFDLRDPAAGGSSGTPFRQIAQYCEQEAHPFHYMVLGINEAMNGPQLFDYAAAQGVQWVADVDVCRDNIEELKGRINQFVDTVDAIHLSVCLDVFPAAQAPGVSAPGVPGICTATGLLLLRHLARYCDSAGVPVLLMDIAEMNPAYDRDGITARLAARLIYEFLGSDRKS